MSSLPPATSSPPSALRCIFLPRGVGTFPLGLATFSRCAPSSDLRLGAFFALVILGSSAYFLCPLCVGLRLSPMPCILVLTLRDRPRLFVLIYWHIVHVRVRVRLAQCFPPRVSFTRIAPACCLYSFAFIPGSPLTLSLAASSVSLFSSPCRCYSGAPSLSCAPPLLCNVCLSVCLSVLPFPGIFSSFSEPLCSPSASFRGWNGFSVSNSLAFLPHISARAPPAAPSFLDHSFGRCLRLYRVSVRLSQCLPTFVLTMTSCTPPVARALTSPRRHR